MIDQTYGHLVPDSEDYLRGLLDTFDSALALTNDVLGKGRSTPLRLLDSVNVRTCVDASSGAVLA